MRRGNKLSSLAIKHAKESGLYGDGYGLYLQVSSYLDKSGNVSLSKSWLFRFMRDGVARKMGLGAVHTVPLPDARQRAALARRALLDGIDPIEARKQTRAARKLEQAKAVTFRECAEKYIEVQKSGWRNEKHATQWAATLATYAYPVIGDLPVAAVDTGLVLKVLEPIWNTKTETASRLRGRIESVLSWATVRNYRSGDNPARWRGHLKETLPKRSKVQKVQHHPAMHYTELPAFMGELRTRIDISARALEFTILTAARTGEAIGAQWSEIEGSVWTIPSHRMKAGKEHKVPLAGRVLEMLSSVAREGEYVFPGAKAGRPLSNMAMLEALRDARPGLTVHGFRSTFRDWAAEQTGYPEFVIEKALAHVVADKVEAAYRRGDLFEKRARLMEEWAKFCGTQGRASAKVTPLREIHHG
jgi:integrase